MKKFHLRYSISLKDFIDAYEEHWKSTGHGTRGNVIWGVVGVIAGIVVGYYVGWIGYALSGVGAVLALMPLWRRYLHMRSFKKYKDRIEVTFDDDRIDVKTNDGESKLKWSTYTKILDTKDYVLLYLSDRAFSIIPKRAFPEKSADFVEFAKIQISQQRASHSKSEHPSRELDYMKVQIDEFKSEDFFPELEWEERGLIPSSDETIQLMRLDMKNFLTFVSEKILATTNREELRNQIQIYLFDWDRYGFDTEETEFIVDEMFRVIVRLGFDSGEFEI